MTLGVYKMGALPQASSQPIGVAISAYALGMPSAGEILPFDRSGMRPGDRIFVAVSGGADSVALLRSVHRANLEPRSALGVGMSVAHVHHGIRGEEADGDLAFVSELCASLDVPLEVQHVDVPGRVAATGETTEEAARHLRYEWFRSLIGDRKADAVLTAHTLDDQTETVLLKFLRGAWTAGLAGIYPSVEVRPVGGHVGKIFRPLLKVRRSEIKTYLRSLGQVWREDFSNSDTAFTRNRVRHDLLPLLRDFNPNLDQALANLATLAREEEDRWRSELERLLPQILLPGKPVRGGGRAVGSEIGEAYISIDIARLSAMDPALRRRVLRAAASWLGAQISFDETSRLLALCGIAPISTVPSRPGARLQLSGQLRAERSPRELRLSAKI